MIQSPVGDSKPAGLGRYRFRAVLSTSFFGSRYRVAYEGAARLSEVPPTSEADAFRSSLRPRPDLPLAVRLVEADAPSLLEQLARAVQAVRELDHRAVVRPLQIVRSSTRLGIVSHNIEGLTLAQLLEDASSRQMSIPPAVALRIIGDLLSGLEALREHARATRRIEWLFGGVTPDSIHVGIDGQARFLDPGVAGAAARQSCWSHEPAALAYTAPEQTGADASFDASSDSFSIGVMLWELLTGRPLFGAATAAQTLERLHRTTIPRVQRHQFVRGEPIAFALAQAVAQSMRREPKQRFTSYAAFAAALADAGDVAGTEDVALVVKQAMLDNSLLEVVSQQASLRPLRSSLPVGHGGRSERLVLPPMAAGSMAAANDRTPAQAKSTLPPSAMPSRPVRSSFWTRSSWLPGARPEKLTTAFPIGDLLRSPRTVRRGAWSLGVAGAALIGLGFWVWNNAGQPTSSSRSAASQFAPPPAAPAMPTPTAIAVPPETPSPPVEQQLPDAMQVAPTVPPPMAAEEPTPETLEKTAQPQPPAEPLTVVDAADSQPALRRSKPPSIRASPRVNAIVKDGARQHGASAGAAAADPEVKPAKAAAPPPRATPHPRADKSTFIPDDI